MAGDPADMVQLVHAVKLLVVGLASILFATVLWAVFHNANRKL